jgi:hypothetical protein
VSLGVWRTAACVLAVSSTGWASGPARYELDYAADPSCPSRADFEELVEAQLAEFGDSAATIQARAVVRFRHSESGVVGQFSLERQNGAQSSRELQSKSCEQAASALAFVLALALGGREASPVDESVVALRLPETAAPEPPSLPTRTRPRAEADSAPELARPVWRWRFDGGVQMGARSGLGPSWTLVETGFLGLRAEQEGRWGTRLRLAVLRGQPIRHADLAGATTFKWLAGRVEGCASRVLFRPITVAPCLASHIGQFTAIGEPEALPGASGERVASVWVEAVLALRFEWLVLQGLSVEAHGEALMPLTRYRFAFDRPDTPVYRVPGAAAAAFLGLAAHFP